VQTTGSRKAGTLAPSSRIDADLGTAPVRGARASTPLGRRERGTAFAWVLHHSI